CDAIRNKDMSKLMKILQPQDVDLLLDGDVDGQTTDGRTPLHLTGHTSTSRLLVKHGADIHARTAQGLSALHLAAQQGHLATVKMLIEEGADPYCTNQNLRTPCHLAAEGGHCEVFKDSFIKTLFQ
uniref:Uncharacterized protein n=1 Tax=Esox lucius TaxID=8010 RepID=A0AAY5KD71_ESOLU